MQTNNGKVRLSDTVVEKLEKMIATMSPGERLPTEMELSELFSVGRSTIREGMKVLTAKKMVVRRNEGTFVTDAVNGCLVDPLNMIINMTDCDINSLIEVREILEVSAVEMAAQRATEEDITELERANWMMNEPGLSDRERQKRDIEFHNCIAKISGNLVLAELLGALRTVIVQNVETRDGDVLYICEGRSNYHDEMILAIAEQDASKARRIMEEYFESVHKTLGI